MKLLPTSLFAVLLLAILTGNVLGQSPPTITRQPRNLTRSLGDRVSFTVSFSSEITPTFQWFHKDQPVPNATNAALILTNIAASAAGAYRAVVSNPAGSVTSEPAVLEVNTLFRLMADSPVSRDTFYGMAWGDYDDDGFPDLGASGLSSTLLYHNNRDGTFSKLPATHTVSRRTYAIDNAWNPIWTDVDNDGILDLFVATGSNPALERDQLFRGLGGGGFQLVTNAPLATDNFANMDAVWGDFDGDGLLDLFSSRINPDFSILPQLLYWRQPDGSFRRTVSSEFALDSDRGGYGATAGDFNGDGRRDIAFALGRGAIMLYENRGDRTFDAIILPGSGSTIGSPAAADYDNDGDLDLFVTFGVGQCQLLRNDGAGSFELVTDVEPVLEPGRTTNAAWGDYDNDGWLDLMVSRLGFYAKDSDNNDSLFRNRGDGTFERVDAGSVTRDAQEGYGCAWGDYDLDGFLDLVASGASATSSRLFHNSGNGNSWLSLRLVGTTSNRLALGARVRVKATLNGKVVTQLQEIGTGAGWSQNDLRAHFGLADAAQVDEIVVDWPSGKRQTLTQVAARQRLTITEPDNRLRFGVKPAYEAVDVTVTGPEGVSVVVESSQDLVRWDERERVTLDAAGKASVRLHKGYPPQTFFRGRMP